MYSCTYIELQISSTKIKIRWSSSVYILQYSMLIHGLKKTSISNVTRCKTPGVPLKSLTRSSGARRTCPVPPPCCPWSPCGRAACRAGGTRRRGGDVRRCPGLSRHGLHQGQEDRDHRTQLDWTVVFISMSLVIASGELDLWCL
jgi:hypothetical protein